MKNAGEQKLADVEDVMRCTVVGCRAFMLAVLLAGLVFSMPGRVYAQDGDQPQEPAAPVVNTEDGGVAAGETPEETPAADEQPPSSTPEAPAGDDQASPAAAQTPQADETPAPTETPVAQVMDGAAELGLEVEVLAPDGQALPLVSQDAAAVIAADPRLCIVNTTTGAEISCGAARATITEALADLQAQLFNPGEGARLRIEAGTFSGVSINITPTSFSSQAPGAFEILGAGADATVLRGNVTIANLTGMSWIGVQGVGVEGNLQLAGNTATRFDLEEVDIQKGGLLLDGNSGAVNLSNTSVRQASGATAPGVEIRNHRGQVELYEVDSNNNPAGAVIATDGNVYVGDSRFNANKANGLVVQSSGGWVTLERVFTTLNGQYGATLSASGAVGVSYATFNDNTSGGVHGQGAYVSLEHVTADDNGRCLGGACGYGAWLNGSDGVDINNSSFTNTSGTGLYAVSNRTVMLGNVTASNSLGMTGSGAQLGGADVYVLSGQFSENALNGLEISSNGNIFLSGVTASTNGGSGGILASQGGVVSVAQSSFISSQSGDGLNVTAGDVSIIMSSFNSNAGNGLTINAGGEVLLGGVSANRNGQDGINVNASATLNGVMACWNGGVDYNGPLPASGVLQTCPSATGEQEPGEEELALVPGQGLGPQVVHVFYGGGAGPFAFEPWRTLIFKLWEKQPLDAPDNRLLAQATLPAYLLPPGGSAGLEALQEAGLPESVSEALFLGPAFRLSLTGADGQALAGPGGVFELRFFLPPDYQLPQGKQLAIMFYNASTGEWQRLETYGAGEAVFAFGKQPGVYALMLVDR